MVILPYQQKFEKKCKQKQNLKNIQNKHKHTNRNIMELKNTKQN